MKMDEKQVLDAAMKLSKRQRAFIADKLLDSLESIHPEIESLWKKEIRKRMASLKNVDESFVSEEEVFKKYNIKE